MDQVMTGKQVKVIFGAAIAGLIIGYLSKRSFNSINIQMLNSIDSADTIQCKERLKEFFITENSLSSAEEEFHELLEMGFSPMDSFEITISKRSII